MARLMFSGWESRAVLACWRCWAMLSAMSLRAETLSELVVAGWVWRGGMLDRGSRDEIVAAVVVGGCEVPLELGLGSCWLSSMVMKSVAALRGEGGGSDVVLARMEGGVESGLGSGESGRRRFERREAKKAIVVAEERSDWVAVYHV